MSIFVSDGNYAPTPTVAFIQENIISFEFALTFTYEPVDGSTVTVANAYPPRLQLRDWATFELFHDVALSDVWGLVLTIKTQFPSVRAAFVRTGPNIYTDIKLVLWVWVPNGLRLQSDYFDIAGTLENGDVITLPGNIPDFSMPPTAPTGVWLEKLTGTNYKIHWDAPAAINYAGQLSATRAQHIVGAILGKPDASGVIVDTSVSWTDLSTNSGTFDLAALGMTATDASLYVSLYNTGFGSPNWTPLPRMPTAATGVTVVPIGGEAGAALYLRVSWASPALFHPTDVVISNDGTPLPDGYASNFTSNSADVLLDGVNLYGVGAVPFTISLRTASFGTPATSTFYVPEMISQLNTGGVENPHAGQTVALEVENGSATQPITMTLSASNGGVWTSGQTFTITQLAHSVQAPFETRRAGALKISGVAADGLGTRNIVFPANYVVAPMPITLSVADMSRVYIAGRPVTVAITVPNVDTAFFDTTYAGVFTMTSTRSGTWDDSSITISATRPFTGSRIFIPDTDGLVAFGITNSELDISVTGVSVNVRDPGLTLWTDASAATVGAPITVSAIYQNPYPGGMGGTIDFTSNGPGWWGPQVGDFSTARAVVTRQFTPSTRGVVTFSARGTAFGISRAAANEGPTWSTTTFVGGTVPSFATSIATSPSFLEIVTPPSLITNSYNNISVVTDVSWSGRISFIFQHRVGAWLGGIDYVDVVAGVVTTPAQWRLTDPNAPLDFVDTLFAFYDDTVSYQKRVQLL